MNRSFLHIALLLVILPGFHNSLLGQPGSFPEYAVTQEKFYAPIQSAPAELIDAFVAAITDIDAKNIVFNGEVFEWLPEKREMKKTDFDLKYRVEVPDLPDQFYLKKSPLIADTKITGIFTNENELINISVHGVFFRVENLIKSGRCYAKALVADEYETVTEQILTKPASTRVAVVPAEYETVTEQVLVKPKSEKIVFTQAVFDTIQEPVLTRAAYYKYNVIPAQYETVTEQIPTKSSSLRIERVPAEYETETITLETAPASTRWVKKANPNCESPDPDDCLVWCLVEVPAQLRTITRKVRKGCPTGYTDNGDDCIRTVEVPAEYTTRSFRKQIAPEKIDSVLIPAAYTSLTKIIMVQPAKQRIEKIPAEYETVNKRVLKAPATARSIEIPAEYATVTRRRLIKEGGLSTWKEVLCADAITPGLISRVKLALLRRGYPTNSEIGITIPDNTMDANLKAALSKFQKDNGLPEGNLDLETLEALGVER